MIIFHAYMDLVICMVPSIQINMKFCAHLPRRYQAIVEVGCGPTWKQGFYLAAVSSAYPDREWKFDRWLTPFFVNSPHLIRLQNGTYVLHFQTGRVVWPPLNQSCSGSPLDPPIGQKLPIPPCEANQNAWTDNCLCSTVPGSICGKGDTTMHVAWTDNFPAGPWRVRMVSVTGPGWTPFNASVASLGESNPTAVALDDGRSLLAFRSHLKGGCVPGCVEE